QSWNPGQNIILQKNPNYFRSTEGLPHFEQLVFRFVGENTNNNIAATMSGECDVVEKIENIAYTTLAELQNNGRLNTIVGQKATWEHLDFGINPASYDDGYDPGDDRPAFFSDTRTRQGIMMCLDRPGAMEAITFGLSELMHTYLPAQHPLFNPKAVQYFYNPSNGIAFLEAAGWILGEDSVRVADSVVGVPDGTRFSINYMARDTRRNQQIMDIFTASLASCGIEIIPDLIPPVDYYLEGPRGRLFGRDFDLAQYAWRAKAIPVCNYWASNTIPGEDRLLISEVPWLTTALSEKGNDEAVAFPFDWKGWNAGGYASSNFDFACNAAGISISGQNNYIENHHLAQIIFTNELPIIPLFPQIQMAVSRPDLCGFSLDPTAASPFWNIESYGIGLLCQ
ncbi:MAG: ABC transporter substrate-binding protein, partial [Chloroflexota bacterium]